MGRLEDEIRELILDQNKSLAVFARKIGLPEHTLYSALNNGLAGATLTTVMPIVKSLGLDPMDLMDGKLTLRHELTGSALVPLCDSIIIGAPEASDSPDCRFPIPGELHERYPEAFMMRVKGNSMNRVLPDGFYALIDPCDSVDASEGLYAVIVGRHNASIKRVILHDNGLTLAPDSTDPTYKPALFDYGEPDTESVSVVGRVVWYCPPIDWAA